MRRSRGTRGIRIKRMTIAVLILAALLFSFIKSCTLPAQDDAAAASLDPQPGSEQTSDMLLNWLGKTLLTPELLMASSVPAISGVSTDASATWQADAAEALSADVEGDTEIDPEVSDDIKVELTNLKKEEYSAPELSGEGPQILIYHTHTCEAYTQTASDSYVATGSWRTNDQSKSVVKVGEELTKLLREQGFNVIHDKTNHEPPKLGTAYDRSLKTMEAYKKKYSSLKIFIDVHRDAYRSLSGKSDQVTIDGKSVARLMFVVGTGEGKTGSGFGEKPNWKANYKLAQEVTDRLNKINSKLARSVCVKTGRYNQHVSDSCMLIEAGYNENTLDQVMNAVPYLAEALGATLKEGG
jgi:stage II sporulation protein P